MLTRRTLLAASAATVAAPAIRTGARRHAEGRRRHGPAIDDIVSFDPAESYEFTNNEVDANCYRRLIRPDANDATRSRPILPRNGRSVPTASPSPSS